MEEIDERLVSLTPREAYEACFKAISDGRMNDLARSLRLAAKAFKKCQNAQEYKNSKEYLSKILIGAAGKGKNNIVSAFVESGIFSFINSRAAFMVAVEHGRIATAELLSKHLPRISEPPSYKAYQTACSDGKAEMIKLVIEAIPPGEFEKSVGLRAASAKGRFEVLRILYPNDDYDDSTIESAAIQAGQNGKIDCCMQLIELHSNPAEAAKKTIEKAFLNSKAATPILSRCAEAYGIDEMIPSPYDSIKKALVQGNEKAVREICATTQGTERMKSSISKALCDFLGNEGAFHKDAFWPPQLDSSKRRYFRIDAAIEIASQAAETNGEFLELKSFNSRLLSHDAFVDWLVSSGYLKKIDKVDLVKARDACSKESLSKITAFGFKLDIESKTGKIQAERIKKKI